MKFYVKHGCIIAVLILLLCLTTCNSKKYIQELPYSYSSDQYIDELHKVKANIDSTYTHIDDNSERLSDEDLKIKEKYSIIMGIMPREITNYKLYSYIDKWIGTPYKKQSAVEKIGVDCTYFIPLLFNDVYGETLSQIPEKIFQSKSIQLFTGRTFLQEGDILFFRYNKFRPISDIGIYLQNDRIIACTTQGLNIYDFNDKYFQLRYVVAGRLKSKN